MASILHELAIIIALYCKAIFATKVCALFPDWALAGLYILCQTHERHKKKLSLKQLRLCSSFIVLKRNLSLMWNWKYWNFCRTWFCWGVSCTNWPNFHNWMSKISFWDGKENWEKYPEEDHIVYSFNIPIYKIFDLLTNAFSAICSIIFVMHVCKLL